MELDQTSELVTRNHSKTEMELTTISKISNHIQKVMKELIKKNLTLMEMISYSKREHKVKKPKQGHRMPY